MITEHKSNDVTTIYGFRGEGRTTRLLELFEAEGADHRNPYLLVNTNSLADFTRSRYRELFPEGTKAERIISPPSRDWLRGRDRMALFLDGYDLSADAAYGNTIVAQVWQREPL